MIIGQLRQLLHCSHCFVTSEHYRVQDLRHDEEVVNLLTKHVFDAKVVQNFKLAAFDCDLWGSLTRASCFVNEELLIELLFNLLEFIKKEALFFWSCACFLTWLSLQISHHEACLIWIALKVSSLSLACT